MIDGKTKSDRLRGLGEFDEEFSKFDKGELAVVITFVGLFILGGLATFLGGISY